MCNGRRSLNWFCLVLAMALAGASKRSFAEGFIAPPSSSPVQQATYREPVRQPLPLSPQSPLSQRISSPVESGKNAGRSGAMSAIFTVLGSLAVVVGLFVGIAWVLRRGLPAGSGRLPGGVVEVLGNAPLAARRQMHVLRFGDKLLLVSVSPNGVDTLSEIEDSAEVERLTKLCQKSRPAVTGTFDQVFGKLMRGTPAEQTVASGGLAAMALRKKSATAGEVEA